MSSLVFEPNSSNRNLTDLIIKMYSLIAMKLINTCFLTGSRRIEILLLRKERRPTNGRGRQRRGRWTWRRSCRGLCLPPELRDGSSLGMRTRTVQPGMQPWWQRERQCGAPLWCWGPLGVRGGCGPALPGGPQGHPHQMDVTRLSINKSRQAASLQLRHVRHFEANSKHWRQNGTWISSLVLGRVVVSCVPAGSGKTDCTKLTAREKQKREREREREKGKRNSLFAPFLPLNISPFPRQISRSH